MKVYYSFFFLPLRPHYKGFPVFARFRETLNNAAALTASNAELFNVLWGRILRNHKEILKMP